VSRPVTEQQRLNRIEQQGLYGAPLGDLFGEVAAVMGLTQSRIAGLLGLSAPMVSQLASGHRVKIGNPAAVGRLQRLVAVAEEVRQGRTQVDAAVAALEHERDEHVLARTSQLTRRSGAADVQHLLRAVATVAELGQAADLLAERHPAIAELLRVYGTGETDQAQAHYERTLDR
jgi:predicted transcriptional regulator